MGAAVVLLALAVLSRRAALPTDGLYRDDAWVAAGAVHGSLSELHRIAWGHPGFTAVLMALVSTGADSIGLVYPVFVAGVLGPAALYLALRWFGFAPSIGAVLGAALLAADTHMAYSGRIKPYAVETLVVLGLAVVLPRLARATWGWPLACGWVTGVLAVSSISGFAMIATGAAGVVLIVASSADRLVRAAAVGVQAAVSVAYLRIARGSYNVDRLEEFWHDHYDAFPDLSLNPVTLGMELIRHATRVTRVFPGGPRWLALVCFGAAVLGLVSALRSRRNGVRAWYLVVVLAAAAAAGFARVLPFGPLDRDTVAPGGRVTLWLIPSVAVGLAAALHLLRSRVGPRSRVWRVGVDVALYVGAVLLVLSVVVDDRPSYPTGGSVAATTHVESELDPSDVVLVFPSSMYEYAAASQLDIELRADTETMTGFVPRPRDARLHVVTTGSAAEAEQVVEDADRVFAYAAILAFSDFTGIGEVLQARGFVEQPGVTYGGYEDAAVRVWRR